MDQLLNEAPRCVGAVLCGGRSSRFGTDKALAPIAGVPMGLRVATAMRDAGADPVVAVGGSAGPALGLVTVADRHPDEGPLGGLVTILRWAGTDLVLAAPCDLPLLDADSLRRLIEVASNTDGAAVATVDGRPQPMLACWPGAWWRQLQTRFNAGDRAWRTALEIGSWTGVALHPDALADADTPADLARLTRCHPRISPE